MHRDRTKYRILLIEDNPGDMVMIEELLSEKIYAPEVCIEKNFREASAVLIGTDEVFDIILLDLTLKDKRGKELITSIVSLAPNTPVIALTGYSDMEFSIQSISLGISDYLLKDGLTSTILYKSIIYCLERKKKVDNIRESEKRYMDIFHLGPQPMWIFNSDTLHFIAVNQAAIQHYGYSEEEFLAMTILDIRPVSDHDRVLELLKDENRHAIPDKGRFRHIKKNGEFIDVEIYSKLIYFEARPSVLVIAMDLTEKLAAEDRVTKAIIKTQEEERQDIGTELHDNVCQLLVASMMKMEVLRKGLREDLHKHLDSAIDLLNLTNKEIRNLSHRLSPSFILQSTFEFALLDLTETMSLEQYYRVDHDLDPVINRADLREDLQLNLYRIAQEQIKNIIKHAKAKNIAFKIKKEEGKIIFIIKDDGIGFEINDTVNGIGLSNIRRRVELFSGNVALISKPNEGCSLVIFIPMENCFE